MKILNSKWVRAIVATLFFSTLLSLSMFVSTKTVEKNLSNQISFQLENELHKNLFSDDKRKTDTKSMQFYMKVFNEKSFSTNIDTHNWLQLIKPIRINLLKLDDTDIVNSNITAIDITSPVTTQIIARGKDRKILYVYDFEYNFPALIILSFLSTILGYLFVFKRVPF
jgi:hypothetical protein